MNWELIVDNIVKKRVKRIPKYDARKLVCVMEELAADPYGGDIEKMEGEENSWRRRVGNYRIFYEIHNSNRIIYIFNLKRRTSNTYR